jgi:hypothetical protein
MEEIARELEQQRRFLSTDMHVLLVCNGILTPYASV